MDSHSLDTDQREEEEEKKEPRRRRVEEHLGGEGESDIESVQERRRGGENE